MSDQYILNPDHTVSPVDLMTWARWFGTHDRKVNNTKLRGCIRVSTVFLGLDHNFMGGAPHLFETLIFGGESDGQMWRCSTWDEAERIHNAVVKLVDIMERHHPRAGMNYKAKRRFRKADKNRRMVVVDTDEVGLQ